MNSQALSVKGLNRPILNSSKKAEEKNNIQPFKSQQSFIGKASEIIEASSFGSGGRLIAQEFCTQGIPKIGVLLLSGRQKLIGYEALLEGSEYLGLYLFPTLAAASGAKIISKILGLPHFSLLGKPFHELERCFKENKPINNIYLNKGLISKCALGQLMTFILTAGAGIAAQMMATAPRVLFIKSVAGNSNFYALSGFDLSEEEKQKGEEDYRKAVKHAWQNLKWGFLGLISLIPSVFGLTYLMGSFTHKLPLNQLAKTFMLNPKFDISKAATIFNLAIAPWVYARTALNEAAKKEDVNRLFFFSIPTLLFFQPFLENIFTLLVGKAAGIKKPLLPLKTAKEEIIAGKREILNISLCSKEHLEKQMSHVEEHKRKKVLKRIEFLNDKGILGFALLWGIAIQIYNFLNTKHAHLQNLQSMTEDHKKYNSLRLPAFGLTLAAN